MLWHGARGTILTLIAIVAAVYSYCTVVYDARLVSNLAYFLDFSVAPKYPKLSRRSPMRLLENGFVAYATRDGFEVSFEVIRYFE